MAGYIPFQTIRPILHRGPVPMPVVNIALVRPTPGEGFCAVPLRVKRKKDMPSDQAVAEMRALRARGDSFQSIATAVQFDPETVRSYTGDVPLPAGHWMQSMGPKGASKREFAERLRRSGFSYREISENIGCSYTATYNLLNDVASPVRGPQARARASLLKLVHAIARVANVPFQDLRKDRDIVGTRVEPSVSIARQVLFWLAYERLGLNRNRLNGFSLTALGKALGGFDHSTIQYSIRRVDAIIQSQGINVVGGSPSVARRLLAADWSKCPPVKDRPCR